MSKRKEAFNKIDKSKIKRTKGMVEQTLEKRNLGFIYVNHRRNGSNHVEGCGYCIHSIPLINSDHFFVCKPTRMIQKGDKKQECHYSYKHFKEVHGEAYFEAFAVTVGKK
jgi:hypothetical protein